MAGDGITGEIRHPPFAVVEKADRCELRRRPHVEPVAGAGRHRHPIVLLTQQLQHFIAQVQAGGSYPTVDAISIHPEHPKREQLRQQFLAEHTHSEDEVRFFVDGRGLFCLHIGDEVLQVLCERNDWLSVPAGTRHWFDMGERPCFSAIRFFNNQDGWVAQFTGDPIAKRYPLLGG